MKLTTLILGVTYCCFAFSNDATTQYYQNLESKKETYSQLKQELHTLLKQNSRSNKQCDRNKQFACPDQIARSYTMARKVLFGLIHLENGPSGYQIKGVYCNHYIDSSYPDIKAIGPFKIPNHNVINAEHTWPQSRFNTGFSRSLQKADLHNLYPTENKVNSMRGNSPFTEFAGKIPGVSACDSPADIGTQAKVQAKRHSNAFEPPAEHKGNVARALFYFSVRYNLPISADEEFHLRTWHELDPVDEDEKKRNNIIHEYQGTRNPFIDKPHLVREVKNF